MQVSLTDTVAPACNHHDQFFDLQGSQCDIGAAPPW